MKADPRSLRRNATIAEQGLWRVLRNRQLGWHKFRRQQPIGPYVADFCCWEARLVVEIDGGQHADSTHDAIRIAWLEQHGWRVMRFWNNDVLDNPDGTCRVLLDALEGTRR